MPYGYREDQDRGGLLLGRQVLEVRERAQQRSRWMCCEVMETDGNSMKSVARYRFMAGDFVYL